jgi:hypothetical protein
MALFLLTDRFAYIGPDEKIHRVDGTDIIDKGAWSPTIAYSVNEVVQYDNMLFIAIAASFNMAPTAIVDDNWSSLVITPGPLPPTPDETYNIAVSGSNLAWNTYESLLSGDWLANAPDVIRCSHVDWGTNADQVNATQMPYRDGMSVADALDSVDSLTAGQLYQTTIIAWAGTATADTALAVAGSGTDAAAAGIGLANQAFVLAEVGTATADTALSIAIAGTDLAQYAITLISQGTDASAALALANHALIIAEAGTATADVALSVAGTGTNAAAAGIGLANQAFVLAEAGTATADTALAIAIAGTNLAQYAITLISEGTDASAAMALAQHALIIAEVGTATADVALRVAGTGTNLAYTALTTAWTGTAIPNFSNGGTMNGGLTVPRVIVSTGTVPVSQAVSGTIYYDMLGAAYQTTTASAPFTIAVSNQTNGAELCVIIVSDGSQRALGYAGGTYAWFGTRVPFTSPTAGNQVVVTFSCASNVVMGATAAQI